MDTVLTSRCRLVIGPGALQGFETPTDESVITPSRMTVVYRYKTKALRTVVIVIILHVPVRSNVERSRLRAVYFAIH